MKLTLAQFDAHLKKSLSPVYLVGSDELLLIQETVDMLRQTAKQAGFNEHTRITAGNSNEWVEQLHNQTRSMSLFSEKQLIEINMHHVKFNATTTKALQHYVENPASDIILLIRTNKIDGKSEKSAWFQKLEKKCIVVAIWPIAANQLPQWLIQRGKNLGLTLSRDLAELIAQQVEGNLLAAAQELEKLCLLNSDAPLTAQHMQDTLTDDARYTVFDLVESTINSNAEKSLRILRHLRDEDTEPTLILWALTREYRIMAELLNQQKQGISLSSLFPKFQIYEKRQAGVRQFLSRNSLEKCRELLLFSAQIDRIIKGGETGNVWNAFEKLVIT